MTPEQFVYWLNGFAELNGETPTALQWMSIKQHLETVFKKVTPVAPGTLYERLVKQQKAPDNIC